MQTADFDHSLFEPNNNEGDKSLLVKFYSKPREDKAKSLEEGRPIFVDVCYVDIRIAGSRTGHIARPATMADKARFPRHYQAFTNREEMPLEGTPLKEWAAITRSRVEELAFINVKTVEQLANMPDNNVAKLMGGNALKQKAKDWLETAKEKAGELKFKQLADEMAEENDTLKEQLAKQGDMLAELTARLDASEKEAPAENTPSRRRRTKED